MPKLTNRISAKSIDEALGGAGDIDEVLFARRNPDPYLGRDERFASYPREKMPELDIETRIKGFREVVTAYTHEQAVKKANRCLQCDLRLLIGCNPPPPALWLPFDEEHISQLPEKKVFISY